MRFQGSELRPNPRKAPMIGSIILVSVIALLTGLAIGWLVASARGRAEAARLHAELDAERRVAAEKIAAIEKAAADSRDIFKSVAADALKDNSAAFLQLARSEFSKEQATAKGELEKREQAVENLVKPISKTLDELREHVTAVEKERKESSGGLNQLLTSLREDQARLQGETKNLVNALRKPSVRGQWGEMTLKRIVELAGLKEHCDFTTQAHVSGEDQAYRPDLVVHLPAGKQLIVDAKTPLDAYLDALQTDSESEAAAHLQRHARHVRDHINVLGLKSYWEQFPNTPEFVVMFLQNEAFLYAALEVDHTLTDYAAEKKVIIATPTTLIAILKSVMYGWRQEALAENAKKVSELGAEMHRRISAFLGHMTRVGKGIDGAREAYDKAVGALERRVLPQARKFSELGVSVKSELEAPKEINATVRSLDVPELIEESEEA